MECSEDDTYLCKQSLNAMRENARKAELDYCTAARLPQWAIPPAHSVSHGDLISIMKFPWHVHPWFSKTPKSFNSFPLKTASPREK